MRETSSWLEARKAWVFVGLFAALGACSDTPETASGAETSDPTDTANKPAGPTSNDAGRVVDGGGSSPSATGRDAGPGKGSVPTAGPDAATSGSGETGTTSSDGGTRSDAGANASDAAVMAGPGETGTDDCTEVPSASDAAPPRAGAGAGQVFFYAPNKNPFVRLRTKMLVPKPPNKRGILFLWPGLQPLMGGNNYNPIGLGVLQPVLTWGPSCAPNHLGDSYDSWWISSQYVNTYGNAKGFTGCHGGASMKVGIGDVLAIDMKLSGTTWTQTVTDEKTGKSVDFAIDLMGQDQNQALFIIEDTYVSPSADLIFLSSVLTYASPAAASCKAGSRGANDVVVSPRPQKDGLECCIPRIVLRAKGVAATSPD